jgi:hypothetical protein
MSRNRSINLLVHTTSKTGENPANPGQTTWQEIKVKKSAKKMSFLTMLTGSV